MTDNAVQNLQRWRQIVGRVSQEWRSLSDVDRSWVSEQLKSIAVVQAALHGLFLSADGENHCRDCLGACCGCGHNHFTLVNLLSFLTVDALPPDPDYRLDCPFLGVKGCRLEVQRRPFNCVTFLCEKVEAHLDEECLKEFYALEKELRALHQRFDRRFAGSSLRGILIRAQSLGDTPFLSKPLPE